MTQTSIDAQDQHAGAPSVASGHAVGDVAGSRAVGWLLALAVALATMVVIVAFAVLALMIPIYMHGALDRAGSPGYLGVMPAEAHALSDATVSELLFGPGTFVDPPLGDGRIDFYDAAEISHLRDARTVLYGLLALAGLSIVVLVVGAMRSRREARLWRAMSVGAGVLSVAFVVIGALFLVAFDAAFTLFHEIFFPGGNWSFDFATERLVQLYPIPFWQEATTVIGGIVIVASGLVWWVARRRARRLEAATVA
jgi:integral membrane protein (TIGR01906 family)